MLLSQFFLLMTMPECRTSRLSRGGESPNNSYLDLRPLTFNFDHDLVTLAFATFDLDPCEFDLRPWAWWLSPWPSWPWPSSIFFFARLETRTFNFFLPQWPMTLTWRSLLCVPKFKFVGPTAQPVESRHIEIDLDNVYVWPPFLDLMTLIIKLNLWPWHPWPLIYLW